MGESACETVVWLATYSTLNVHKGQRVKIAHEALSPFAKRCLPTKYVVEEPSSIGYVVGLVRVQVASRVHRLLRLTASEQEQLNLYQDIFSRNMLGGDAFIVRVLSAAIVEPFVRLQHFGTNWLTCFLISLEHGQPETLLRDMVANRMLCAWMPDAPPGGAIRVPEQYAVLASSGVWNSLILPSFHNNRSSRGEVHALQWVKIGIQPREVPALFARCESMPDECVPLTAEVATQVADFLREQATSMDDSTEFFTETFMAIAQCTSALDTFADELRPVSFVKAVSKSCLQRNYRTEYKVAYLIHAFLHADILRDSSGLQAAVRLAFSTCQDTCGGPWSSHLTRPWNNHMLWYPKPSCHAGGALWMWRRCSACVMRMTKRAWKGVWSVRSWLMHQLNTGESSNMWLCSKSHGVGS